MKKLLYTFAIVFVVQIAFAQENTGIIFLKEKTWAETIALAKKENKLIFVDVFTDWCGPCKVMDAEVFPKKNVGEKFNASFINYKLDAEKGEGPALAKRYLVKSYPNYLFINGDGVLIYRSTSSMSPMEFLGVAANALIEAKQEQTIVQLDLLYPSNKKDKVFMYNYLIRRTVLRLDNADLLDEYIKLLNEDERGEIKNLQLILDNGMYLAKSIQLGISLETLKKHRDKFSQLKQSYKEGISGIENTAITTTLKKAISQRNEKLLTQVLALKKTAKTSYFNNKETTQLAYFLGAGQNEKYINLAKVYINDFLLKISLDTLAKMDEKTYSSQVEYLKNDQSFKGDIQEVAQQYKHSITIQLTGAINDFAKSFSNLSADTVSLKMAIGWLDYCEKITNQDKDYYKEVIPFYTETYAILCYKNGDKKFALAKMETMLTEFKNPRMTAYFSPLIDKMKANEKL